MKKIRQHSVLKKTTLVTALGGVMLVMGATASMQARAIAITADTSNSFWTSIEDPDVTVGSGVTVQGGIFTLNYPGTTSTVTNWGTINYVTLGVSNTGSLGLLTNFGTITGDGFGVGNYASMGTLSNDGYIAGGSVSGPTTAGFANQSITSNIDMLSNETTGTIYGAYNGVLNNGVIGTLNNFGRIEGGVFGISNTATGSITSLQNAGTLTSGTTALANAGTIDALSNSGLISAPIAIFNSGSLGSITNRGIISGDIINNSASALTINGATGGTLTGYTTDTISRSSIAFGQAMGTITSGGDVVLQGSLYLNDHVDLGGTGTLSSTGTIGVLNTVSITGNYSQSTGSYLLIGVSSIAVAEGTFASDSGYGRLVVSGTATVASGATVALTGLGYSFAAGQRFVVIDGGASSEYNTTTGTYGAIGYSGTVTGSTVTLDSGRKDLVLTLSGGDSSSGGSSGGDSSTTIVRPTTPNAVSSLKGLGNYSGIQAGLLDLYNASLAISSTGEANRVGAQLAPTQNFSASTATSSATFDALNVVGAHVDSIRLAQANGATGIATGDSPRNWAAWGQVYGGHASQGMVDGISGYTATYGGLVAGVDRAVNDRWRAGGAFVYSNTSVHGSDDVSGNTSSVNSYGVIGYASYTGEPWYVNLSASATLQQYNSNRAVSFTGFSGTAKGEFNGSQYVAKAEFGYPLALSSGFTVTPLAAVSYSYQHQNSYSETGGNGAALNVGSTHNNALRSSLGAKLEKSFSTSYGDVVPFVQALWTHQYNSGRASTTASYAADTVGETGFTTLGATPARDIAEFRTGVNLLRGTSTSISLRYDLQAASQYTAHTVSLRLRQLF